MSDRIGQEVDAGVEHILRNRLSELCMELNLRLICDLDVYACMDNRTLWLDAVRITDVQL